MSKKRAKQESQSRAKLSMRYSNDRTNKNERWNPPVFARLAQSNSLKAATLIGYLGGRARKQANKLEHERRACVFGIRRPDTK